jgi:hypothetical protein
LNRRCNLFEAMKILALDLGTATGWAWGESSDSVPHAGTWALSAAKEVTQWGKQRITRRCDPRPIRLYKRLHDLCEQKQFVPDVLIFEDVEFSSYTKQCQLWASYRTAAWMFAHWTAISHVDCVPVGTLKLYATGFGGASKEQMATALFQVSPSLKDASLDDNAIDAIWLWKWAKENLQRLHL